MSANVTNWKPDRPWLTIFYRPRSTMREIHAYNPMYGVRELLGLYFLIALLPVFNPVDNAIIYPDPIEILLTLTFLLVWLLSTLGITKIAAELLGRKISAIRILSSNVWPTLPLVYAFFTSVLVSCPFGRFHSFIWFMWGGGYLYYCVLLASALEETLNIEREKAWIIVILQMMIPLLVSFSAYIGLAMTQHG